jgi:MFS family permease
LGEFALPTRHFALLLGMLLAVLDQTIVAIALPTVAGDLSDLSDLSWSVAATAQRQRH